MRLRLLAAGGLLALAACAAPPAEPKVNLAALEEIANPPPLPLEVAAERCREAQTRGTSASPARPGPTPIIRTMPNYPSGSLMRELEGSCTMTFDVASDGLVDAGSVVAECTDEMFVEPSIRAVERWCFAPASADSDPEQWSGVRSLLRFDIANDDPPVPTAPPSKATP